MKRLAPFILVAALFLTALGRDALDDWVDATDMPLVAVCRHPYQVKTKYAVTFLYALNYKRKLNTVCM